MNSLLAELKDLYSLIIEFLKIWFHSILQKLCYSEHAPSVMECDKQVGIFIANNPTFHERMIAPEIVSHNI